MTDEKVHIELADTEPTRELVKAWQEIQDRYKDKDSGEFISDYLEAFTEFANVLTSVLLRHSLYQLGKSTCDECVDGKLCAKHDSEYDALYPKLLPALLSITSNMGVWGLYAVDHLARNSGGAVSLSTLNREDSAKTPEAIIDFFESQKYKAQGAAEDGLDDFLKSLIDD